MKLLTIILGLYICLLSVLPCHDGEDNAVSIQTTSISSHPGTDQPFSDVCSPFCICSCCSSVRNISTIGAIITPALPLTVVDYPLFKTPDLPWQSYEIWQPPQIS